MGEYVQDHLLVYYCCWSERKQIEKLMQNYLFEKQRGSYARKKRNAWAIRDVENNYEIQIGVNCVCVSIRLPAWFCDAMHTRTFRPKTTFFAVRKIAEEKIYKLIQQETHAARIFFAINQKPINRNSDQFWYIPKQSDRAKTKKTKSINRAEIGNWTKKIDTPIGN